MSRRPTRDTTQANSLLRYLPKPPTGPTNALESKKRLVVPPTTPSTPQLAAKSLPLSYLLRTVNIEEVLQSCPAVVQILSELQSRSQLDQQVLKSIIKKHLQSGDHSLWSHKYRPLECLDLFNEAMGERIQSWIQAFHEYKQKINEEDESFFNQNFDEKSGRVCDNIAKFDWKLEALVVQGPPGIGKSSAVRAITHQMGYELQECGNDYNQTKYLKEKNESTQSESVKTAMSRRTKVVPPAQMITKFMPPVAEKQRPSKEHRKAQLIHNVGDVHPAQEANRFYHQLARCVSLSKIPFILTNSGHRLPKECEHYDRVEYQLGNHSKIERTLWVIYHIEHLLPLKRSVLVQSGGLLSQLTKQTDKCQFREVCGLETVREVCKLHNYRLDYTFTFLQHYPPPSQQQLHALLRQKLSRISSQQLLSQIRHTDSQALKKIPLQKRENLTLKQCRMELDLLRNQDCLGEHALPCNIVPESLDSAMTSIDTSVHRNIKSTLTKQANQQITLSHQKLRSSLAVEELVCLPMLFRERRSSRSATKITQQQRNSTQHLLKVYSDNQCIYLEQYGNLLRPQ